MCVFNSNTISQYFQEWINFGIRIGENICNFTSLYVPFNQPINAIKTFEDNYELNLGAVPARSLYLIVFWMSLTQKRRVGAAIAWHY